VRTHRSRSLAIVVAIVGTHSLPWSRRLHTPLKTSLDVSDAVLRPEVPNNRTVAFTLDIVCDSSLQRPGSYVKVDYVLTQRQNSHTTVFGDEVPFTDCTGATQTFNEATSINKGEPGSFKTGKAVIDVTMTKCVEGDPDTCDEILDTFTKDIHIRKK